MIPVEPQPEPGSFETTVRRPGKAFLNEVPHPNTNQWEGKSFWRKALPDMKDAYGGICSYCAFWIPYSTGNGSIDHFIPRKTHPELAYEWSNFRFVSARFNSRKGTGTIVDPFTLSHEWFVLDFSTFFIWPNSMLQDEQRKQITETIDRLKLNTDDDLVDERFQWYIDYLTGKISFEHVRKKAPFLAYEIERQNQRV